MNDWEEPWIEVNGHPLGTAQAMSLRVAATSMLQSMVSDGLGDDELGKQIAEGYAQRLREVLVLMHRPKEADQ